MSAPGHGRCAAVLGTAAFLALGCGLHAAWIPLKAELAQWLIERSWQRTLAGEEAPPWPWADTRAAGVLTAPRLGERLLVLEGSSGRNLAFGPALLSPAGVFDDAGLLDGVGAGGDIVISGHRDTHFHFLQDLRPGDRLQLSGRAGSRWYAVGALEVIDSSRLELVIDPGRERLSLVTCYPFDSPRAGGPLRYVVTAYPLRS